MAVQSVPSIISDVHRVAKGGDLRQLDDELGKLRIAVKGGRGLSSADTAKRLDRMVARNGIREDVKERIRAFADQLRPKPQPTDGRESITARRSRGHLPR